MKERFFQLAILLFAALIASFPEATGQDILQKHVSVSAEDKELKKVLEGVQDQAGVKFTYSGEIIGAGRKINCDLRHKKLVEFLDGCLLPLGIKYRIIDAQQILLFRPQEGPDEKPEDVPAPPVARREKRLVVVEVRNQYGLPLPDVSVIEEGTGNGTVTDVGGRGNITVFPTAVLRFSLVGYKSREVAAGNHTVISIILAEEVKAYDEVIVTGVFEKSHRMESALAITTLNEAEFAKMAPASAADLLRNVPGVFVNSSLGEIRNIVYSRGVSANSTEAAFGYYYVSMQEDGLPVSNVTFSNYGPDYFMRPDATLKKLEAVRAGTSSILGANAPGGIFNYISKTGGEQFAGIARAKYGIEGNGNGYYRADINAGGPLNKKGWFYNAGGFYRYSQGARYVGYPLNKGGQFRANLLKQYRKGSLKLHFKLLNDRNGWFEFLPARNFSRPRLAPGVKQTDTYLLQDATTTYPFLSPGSTHTFDPTVLTHSRETAIGNEWIHSLGNGWKLSNNFRYSFKKQDWQSSALVYPLPVDSPNLYNLMGTLGRAGMYTFSDRGTGNMVAQAWSPNGVDFSMVKIMTPGAGVMAGGLLTQLGYVNFPEVREYIDQLIVSKKVKNLTFTGGAFYARSVVEHMHTLPGMGIGTIEHRPRLLDITLTDTSGKLLRVTNPQGYTNLGGILELHAFQAVQHDKAVFFEQSWQKSKKLKLEAAFRYEHIRVKGTNHIADPNPRSGDPSYGGADNDPATLYDNRFFVPGATYRYNKGVGTFSYSLGANYKISDKVALYGRYSLGQKSPDLSYYFAYDSRFKLDNDEPRAQHTTQAELGFIGKVKRSRIFVTPFYSLLSNVVFSYAPFPDSAGGLYFPMPLYNSIRTIGLECEAEYRISTPLQLRAIVTVQTAKTLNWKNWLAHGPGRQDDEIQDYSGYRADNNPKLILNLTPSYTGEKLYSHISWKYLGKRPGNIPGTIILPGFSQFDFGAGWNLNQKSTLGLNINNLFNSEGVMSWAPPGGYPAALDRQGFTRSKLEANPNAPFGIICIQPRCFYLTLSSSF